MTSRLRQVLTLTTGIAIGALLVVVVRVASSPSPTEPVAIDTRESSGELGAKLLQRVGRNLIADDRRMRGDGPITFYAVPKAYGDVLCRVDVYSVAPKIIQGRASDRELWEDDLKIETRYGLWKRPSADGGDRDKACAAYRDFDHLIGTDNGLSVERAAFVMDMILTEAKANKIPFEASCVKLTLDFGGRQEACDPQAVLRLVSLKDIGATKEKSRDTIPPSPLHRDEIWIEGGRLAKALAPRRFTVMIEVEDRERTGRRTLDAADPLSVKIEIAEYR